MVQTAQDKQAILEELFGGAEERQKIAAAWNSMPANQPLPDTSEVRDALFDMLIGMYGDALRQL